MISGDNKKTRGQLIAELDDMRRKIIHLASLSEMDAIFKVLPDIYLRMDESGTILDFKSSHPDVLFDLTETYVGRNIEEFLPRNMYESFCRAMGKVKDTGTLEIFECTFPVEHRKNHYEARLLPFSTDVLTIFRNITERKEVEEEIGKHREHLQVMVDERTVELETMNLQLQEEITERKKMEQELREREENYKRLFALGNDARFVYLMEDDGPGRFIKVNDVACRRLGYSREEFLQITPEDISRYSSPDVSCEVTNRLLREGVAIYETIHITRDGVEIPVEISAQLFQHQGQAAVIANARDITERKKAEMALQIAKETAESANRLKSRFLANMSHDIRTPLNSILGFADLLLKESIEARSRRYVNNIINSGDALLNLINDILDFSKIEAEQLDIYPDIFVLRELKESIRSMFEFQFKRKGIEFTITLSPSVPEKVYGDKWRIHQVLSNLLSNAMKFTEKGSVKVDIDYDEGSDQLFFKVEDTGIGIPRSELKNIFQPFMRLQHTGALENGGTGIGLAICRDLVDLMGGDIRVQSMLNKGSRFMFEIPAAVQKVDFDAGPAKKSDIAVSMATNLDRKLNNSILIVDDSAVNQELILEQLKKAGFKYLLQATDGHEAVRLALTHSPDLILMDIQMPVMGGNQAIEELRRSGYTAPIIALSAFAMREHINRSLLIGADAYITKPIDFSRFFSKINPFLKEKPDTGIPNAPLEAERGGSLATGVTGAIGAIHAIGATGTKKSPEKTCTGNNGRNHFIKDSVSKRVRGIFLEDAREKMKVMDLMLEGNETDLVHEKEQIKIIAHNYKGNAGFLGLNQLENTARRVDQAFKNEEPNETLLPLVMELKETLAVILKQNKP
jgi:PAS domain S-box-containing protein